MKATPHLVAVALIVEAACGGRGNGVVPPIHGLQQTAPFAALAAAPVASPTPSPMLYVANRSSNAVTIYRPGASGGATPVGHISGVNTSLDLPAALGFDGSRKLYVLNAASIAVFGAGARGDVSPQLLVEGGLTQLNSPQGMAVASTGKVFVTNQGSGGGYLTAYAPGANGDRAPVQTIFDGSSLLFVPSGIALHGSLLYVADQGDQTINEYGSSANGIVNPVRVVSGLSNPTGVAVDAQGLIYVTDGNSIVVYAASANGDAQPLRVMSGPLTRLDGPAGLSLRGTSIVVADSAGNAVTFYPQLGNGDIKPLRVLAGPNTELDGPSSAAVR